MRFADMSRQAFIEQFRTPPGQATDYHAGIPQALTLMHGGLIHSATDVATSGLLEVARGAVLHGRAAARDVVPVDVVALSGDEEREVMVKADRGGDERRGAAAGAWAMCCGRCSNSAEFTLNH